MNKRKVQIVVHLPITKEYLLLKTNERRGFFWQNITGGVEEGESFEQAALREFQEETGIDSSVIEKIIDLEMDFEFHDQWKNDVIEKVYYFKLLDKPSIKIDPNEHQDYRWISDLREIKNLIKYSSNYKAINKVEKL